MPNKKPKHIESNDAKDQTRCGLWIDSDSTTRYSVLPDRSVTEADARRLIKQKQAKSLCVRCKRQFN